MREAPAELITVIVQGKPVVLDPSEMRYNENTLAEYLSREYGWVDFFGKQLEYAQKEVLLAEIDSEAIQALKFMESKDSGHTDSYAKSYSLAHVDVVAAKKKVAERKEAVGHIKAHLKAWSENHENVQNRGHTLRREMDKLNRDIYSSDDTTCSAEDFLGK